MTSFANSNNTVSGIAALINVQKHTSSHTSGDRQAQTETPTVEAVTPRTNNQRDNNSREENAASETGFSKLIAKDNEVVTETPRSTTSAMPVKATMPQENAATPKERSETTDDTTASFMLVLLQLQTIQPPLAANSDAPAPTTEATTDANQNVVAPITPEVELSLEDLIAQMRSLLDIALKLMNDQLPANTQSVTIRSTQITTSVSETTLDLSQTNQQPSATDLIALVQSLLKPQQASVNAALTNTDASDALSVGEASSNPLSEVLAKLVSVLEKVQVKINASSNDAAKDASSEDASSKDNSFKQLLASVDATSGKAPPAPVDAGNELQQAVSRVIDALTTKEPTFVTDNAPDANASNLTTPNAPTQQNALTQSATTSEFAKQLQQAAPQLPPHEQVLVNIKNAVSDGLSQLRIQLHPEDLGRVEVQLTTSADGKTGVSITADNRHTLAMLQNDARALQDALRDIGLKTDAGSLNFNLRDSGQDARNSRKQQQGGYTNVAAVDEIEEAGFSTAGALYRISVQQGLDIRV